jgi:hypothetical protein
MINKATILYTDSYLGIYRNYKLNSLAALYEWEMIVPRIASEMGSQSILLQTK